MNEHGEPTQDQIRRAYPAWNTWGTGDGQLHARRVTPGAALTAGPAEDWLDLLDQIRRAEAMLEDTPEGVARAMRRFAVTLAVLVVVCTCAAVAFLALEGLRGF